MKKIKEGYYWYSNDGWETYRPVEITHLSNEVYIRLIGQGKATLFNSFGCFLMGPIEPTGESIKAAKEIMPLHARSGVADSEIKEARAITIKETQEPQKGNFSQLLRVLEALGYKYEFKTDKPEECVICGNDVFDFDTCANPDCMIKSCFS